MSALHFIQHEAERGGGSAGVALTAVVPPRADVALGPDCSWPWCTSAPVRHGRCDYHHERALDMRDDDLDEVA